jgi:hypothetical protein
MMKVAPFLVATLLLTGCAQHYDMVLTNGVRVTNVTKPVLNEGAGYYTYKDVSGAERRVSQSRVLEIRPHSRKGGALASNGH